MIRYITVTQRDENFEHTALVNAGVVTEWKEELGERMECYACTATREDPSIVVKVLDTITAEWTVYKHGRIVEWYK